MEAAGVKVRVYRPLRVYSIYRVGNRTHRRILTVDGRIGFCGGVAIDDRWLGDARNPREWRDTVARVEGPVVAQLQAIFMEDWLLTTGEVLNGDRQFPRVAPAGAMLAQAVAASRTDQSSMAKLLVYMAIQAARERIWIENAYFVPDRQIREGLIRAVERGVDVKVIVPGEHIDIPAIRMASRYHYGELLDGGVEIYEYLPAMMHNKVMVVDGIWSTIGSINLDNRSMRKNAEVNVAIYDRGFARAMEEMIEADRLSCERFTKERWKKRGFAGPVRRAVLLALLGELLSAGRRDAPGPARTSLVRAGRLECRRDQRNARTRPAPRRLRHRDDRGQSALRPDRRDRLREDPSGRPARGMGPPPEPGNADPGRLQRDPRHPGRGRAGPADLSRRRGGARCLSGRVRPRGLQHRGLRPARACGSSSFGRASSSTSPGAGCSTPSASSSCASRGTWRRRPASTASPITRARTAPWRTPR